MAVQPIDYLKEKFNNLKTPDGQDFSDLIDSCHNLAVSGLSAGFVLSVNGSVSAGDYVYDKNGNSIQWNSSYTTVETNSSNWDSVYTTVNTNSASWYYQGTDLKNLSSNWEDTYTLFGEQSANNDSVYTAVNSNSANWDTAFASTGVDLTVRSLTAGWVGGNDAYTNLVSNSAAYLSGVDLSFLSVSGNWNSSYTTVSDNSATTWNYQGTDLKGLSSGWVGGNSAYTNLVSNSAAYLSGVDLNFLSVSANWNSTYTTVNSQSADNGSVYTSVNANSASYATISFTNNKFLPLTGGNITGKTYFYDNLTVYGNVSATGNSYFSNTIYSTTSALSVINIGNTGPALYVGNNGSGDIASFYDIDQNVEILHVGGNNSLYPNVGIKVSNPNKDFTVKGELSASSIIWDSNGNSNQWNNAYANVNSNSANWNSVYTTVNTNSATFVKTVETTTPGTSAVTAIIAVSALPISPNPNTLYIVL